MVRSRVIYQTFVCHQSHRTNERALINVAAGFYRNYGYHAPIYSGLRGLAPRFHDTDKRNTSKKTNFHDVEIEVLSSQEQSNQLVLFDSPKSDIKGSKKMQYGEKSLLR